MKRQLLQLSSLTMIFVLAACAPKKEMSPDESLSLATANLKAVEAEYVPESISDTGATVSTSATTSANDICAGVDFVQCQPRLIRAYLLYGRASVALTLKVVTDVAKQLAGA